MKNFKIYTLFVFLLLLWSCEDAIYVDPADEIVESNAITSVDDVQDAMIGVYATLGITNPVYWDALFTDELRISDGNNGQGIQTHTWSITTGNGEAAGIYGSFSTMINRANRILVAMEGITSEDTDEQALLNRYRGELLAIRAWAHFTMATYYAPSFTADALAVPYVDYVVILQTPTRNTWGEVLAGVQADLDEAESLLPDSFTDVYFFNADAVTALRSRIALYTGNYDAAIGYATELINKVSLPSLEEFPLIWTDETVEGQILKFARVTGDGALGQLFNPSPALTYFNPSNKLLDAYPEGDVRLDVYFDDQDRIWKYPGIEGDIGLNDHKVFRIAEQYLIRAEANLRKSSPDLEAAAADYNALRAQRIEDYVAVPFPTASSGLNLIMEERYREFAYEAHRFVDLKRTNRPVDRVAADCEDLAAENACFLPATSHLWALPIPQSEIFVNDEMDQNPGYNE